MLSLSKNPRLTSRPLLLPFYLLLYTWKSRKFFIPTAIRKIVLYIGTFFLILFSFFTCDKSTAPENKPQVTLSAEYVGVTEAEIHLQTRNTETNTQYQLFRDDSLISDRPLLHTDTTITDTLLLPAHNYNYKARLIKEGKSVANSQPLYITTMDTTSHKFQWESYTIESPFGSALLYDVAIINPTNIWAVGSIAADSANPGIPYNAVHWDGSEWELMRIYFPTICGQSSLTPYPAKAIFSFDDGRIWISSSGDKIAVLQDNHQISNFCLPSYVSMSINKIWGAYSNDLYVVGSEGLIAHYNGTSWQKLESGKDLPIQDIWGVVYSTKGQNKILAVACRRYTNVGSAVAQITGNTIELIQTAGLPTNISGVWSADGREWYICGDGLFKSRDLTKPWQEIADQPLLYKEKVRGNGVNDIFVVGYLGLVSHWNGYSWHTYPAMPGNYYGLAVQGDLVVAVGQETAGGVGGPAAILMGRRIQ